MLRLPSGRGRIASGTGLCSGAFFSLNDLSLSWADCTFCSWLGSKIRFFLRRLLCAGIFPLFLYSFCSLPVLICRCIHSSLVVGATREVLVIATPSSWISIRFLVRLRQPTSTIRRVRQRVDRLVAKAGLTDEQIPLDQLATRIAGLVKRF